MAMVGLMQHRELVITHIIDYAARWHGEQVCLQPSAVLSVAASQADTTM